MEGNGKRKKNFFFFILKWIVINYHFALFNFTLHFDLVSLYIFFVFLSIKHKYFILYVYIHAYFYITHSFIHRSGE